MIENVLAIIGTITFAVAVAIGAVAALLWLALWVRTRLLVRKGERGRADEDDDTDEIEAVE